MSTCDSCFYWDDFMPNEKPIEGYKVCRRYPPNRISIPGWHEMELELRQGVTMPNWWCGEYKKGH